MVRIPRDVVEAVRERTNIAEIVGRHVALRRSGRNLVGLCPFHQERTPSFNVIPDKGIYHCFGCQEGGDVFKFVMNIEGLSFGETVRELAGPAGVVVPDRELSPEQRQELRQRASVFEVLQAAAEFYQAQLWTDRAGEAARHYLERRELTSAFARSAGLGWAPGRRRLLDHLRHQGFGAEQVLEAGLALPSKHDSGIYEFLRERLVIPIQDYKGRVIAFGGRLLEGEGPKYLNTPESPVYQKSEVLYGLHKARGAVSRRGRILIVEGYFDVLSLQQAGFEEAVATCGTSLTAQHLKRIRPLTQDVVVLMDGDNAGLRAAERSLPLFVEARIQPWRLTLPFGKDPDDLVRERGPEALEEALARREPLFEWVVGRKLDQYGNSAMSRQRVLDEVIGLLQTLQDPLLAASVARRLGIQETTVLDRLRRAPRAPAAAPPTPEPDGWRPTRDVVHLLWLLVHHPDEVCEVVEQVDEALLERLVGEHPEVRDVLRRLIRKTPIASLEPTDARLQRTLREVASRDELYEREVAATAVVEVLCRMEEPQRAARLAAATEEIKRMEREGDDSVLAAIERHQRLVAEERRLAEAIAHERVPEILAILATTREDTA